MKQNANQRVYSSSGHRGAQQTQSNSGWQSNANLNNQQKQAMTAQKVPRAPGQNAFKQRAVSSTRRGQNNQNQQNGYMNVQTIQQIQDQQQLGISKMVSAPNPTQQQQKKQGEKPLLFINKNYVNLYQKQPQQQVQNGQGITPTAKNVPAVAYRQAFGHRTNSSQVQGSKPATSYTAKLNAQLQQQYLNDIDNALQQVNLQQAMTPQNNAQKQYRTNNSGNRGGMFNPYNNNTIDNNQAAFFENRRVQSNPRAAGGVQQQRSVSRPNNGKGGNSQAHLQQDQAQQQRLRKVAHPDEQQMQMMSKEEVQKLIFSNSNALMMPSDDDQQRIKNNNMNIVSTNHQFLIDQNITASNMVSSHQAMTSNLKKQPAHLIHVNDQSNTNEITDDNAASSQTRDDLPEDNTHLTRGSGALIVADATSEAGSMPSAKRIHRGVIKPTPQNPNDIQITTGAYSLQKTNDLDDSIAVQQNRMSPSQNAILVQNNGVTVEESLNSSKNNPNAYVNNNRRKPAQQKQRARTNLRGAQGSIQQQNDSNRRSNAYNPNNVQIYAMNQDLQYGRNVHVTSGGIISPAGSRTKPAQVAQQIYAAAEYTMSPKNNVPQQQQKAGAPVGQKQYTIKPPIKNGSQQRYNKNKSDMRRITSISPQNQQEPNSQNSSVYQNMNVGVVSPTNQKLQLVKTNTQGGTRQGSRQRSTVGVTGTKISQRTTATNQYGVKGAQQTAKRQPQTITHPAPSGGTTAQKPPGNYFYQKRTTTISNNTLTPELNDSGERANSNFRNANQPIKMIPGGMQAINNYTNNNIFDLEQKKTNNTQQAANPGVAANVRSASQNTQMKLQQQNNPNRAQQAFTALQNPIGQLATFSSIGELGAQPNTTDKNIFVKVVDNKQEFMNRRNPQPTFESKKLSKSIVVYHQMKNNLMQSQGVSRGSRYNHGMANAMLSEENFEEHFNSLLLDNKQGDALSTELNAKNGRISNVDQSTDGLAQALQDHLNKQEDQSNTNDNYEKYHLRIKKSTYEKSDHTAATSGNFVQIHSRKLALNKNKMADSEGYHPNERLALSGILSSSINESNFKAGKVTKMSNQNALLSLLSQDDFSQLKNQIHGKIVQSPNTGTAIEERLDEQENMEGGLSQDLMSQGDECIVRK